MTFTRDPAFVKPVVDMMMSSRETVVDYMTPLGLAHLMGTGHHYGPAPWVDDLGRADWTPVYYHRANRNGIGFDRGPKGSGATTQYSKVVAKQFEDVKQTPEQFLLWFHHLPWTHRVSSGRTLWEELVHRYTRGVEAVAQMQRTWESLAPQVDPQRFEQVKAYLAIQREEAQWWRDACIAYFQSLNRLPLPAGFAPPKHSLEYYRSLKFPYAPGRG
jgi:alpha-glucuronidase